jgi:hypothetical protein
MMRADGCVVMLRGAGTRLRGAGLTATGALRLRRSARDGRDVTEGAARKLGRAKLRPLGRGAPTARKLGRSPPAARKLCRGALEARPAPRAAKDCIERGGGAKLGADRCGMAIREGGAGWNAGAARGMGAARAGAGPGCLLRGSGWAFAETGIVSVANKKIVATRRQVLTISVILRRQDNANPIFVPPTVAFPCRRHHRYDIRWRWNGY